MKSIRPFSCFIIFIAMIFLSSCSATDTTGTDGAKKNDASQTTDVAGETQEGQDGVGSDSLVGADLSAEDSAETEDQEPPEITLNIVPYTAMQDDVVLDAAWSDNIGVKEVIILIDEVESGPLNMETKILNVASLDPGAHQFALRAVDDAGNQTDTDAVTIIIAGKGQFLPFATNWGSPSIPGWAGFTVSVPEGATEVYDEKSSVQMPVGIKRVMAFLRWKSENPWNIGYDIGTGTCPHSGTKLAEKVDDSNDALIVVVYTRDGLEMPLGKWFAHLRFLDGAEHQGETQQFDALFLILPE